MPSFYSWAVMLGLSIALVSASATPSTFQKRSPNLLMIFDCTNGGLGDVCDNMCYGANCAGWGVSFTWDKPNKSLGGMRSTKAGCGSANRCSKSPYGTGYQCDEYPFKSVSQADKGGQVNRCVLSKYNNAQSQVIRNFYNSQGSFKGTGCGKVAPCNFNIVFANAGLIGYCQSKCHSDSNEQTKNGPAKHKRDEPTGANYLLDDGSIVYSPTAIEIGSLAYKTVPINATLFNWYNENHVFDESAGDEQYDYMMHNLNLTGHTVVSQYGNSTGAI